MGARILLKIKSIKPRNNPTIRITKSTPLVAFKVMLLEGHEILFISALKSLKLRFITLALYLLM